MNETLSLALASVQRSWHRQRSLVRALANSHLSRRGAEIRKRKVWLFGAMVGRKYTDNSAALYRYVRENYPDIDARWVIDRDSPDVPNAMRDGPVVFLDDPDAYLYGLLAEVHVISHGVHDVPACSSRLSRAFKVRLGHGMTALVKRAPPSRLGRGSLDDVFDLVPVSSTFEAANKREWGFRPEKLAITGIARFDELLERRTRTLSVGRAKRILYMPTARDWLSGRVSRYQDSDYRDCIMRFLGDPGLNSDLEKHDSRLSVFMHPLMWDHLPAVLRQVSGLSHVDVLPAHADLQEALVSSDLFVTDYSSVAWDALYVGVPVMFFQFDASEYFKYRGRGSHVDLDRDLFGPVARDPATAAALVRSYLASDFADLGYGEKMRSWRQKAFVAVDTNNRKRVFEAIVAGLSGR